MRIESVWNGIEGIVLDAVGTLIDPEPPVAWVYAEAARRQGTAVDEQEVRARFARRFRDDEAELALETDEPNELRRWRRIVGSVLGDLPDPERAFRELWDHFGRPGAWTCFPDVAPALEALSARGMPIGIASNFDGRLRAVIAGLPELSGRVGTVVISSEVGFRKPHPAFYRAVCERMGLQPGQILFVGDGVENDVVGAQRVGLRGVWLDRRGHAAPGDVPRVGNLVTLVSYRGA